YTPSISTHLPHHVQRACPSPTSINRLFSHFCHFPCSAPRRDLPSFPTRRSSDLARGTDMSPWPMCAPSAPISPTRSTRSLTSSRSEEHTSELQSREKLVCRLLLEKKKNSTGCETGTRQLYNRIITLQRADEEVGC